MIFTKDGKKYQLMEHLSVQEGDKSKVILKEKSTGVTVIINYKKFENEFKEVR